MSKDNKTGGGNFDALLAEIQGATDEHAAMAKSLEDGAAERIEGAADEGAGEGEGEGDDKAAAGDGEGEGESPLGKALTMTDAEGNPVEGYDATELLKSLQTQVETLEANQTKGNEALFALVKSQGALIKSLHEQVQSFGAQGRGRRAVLAVSERPAATADLAKSHAAEGAAAADAGMPKQEFLAKALVAAEQGLISYHDANLAETMINRGQQPQEGVVKAVAKIKAAEA